MATLASAYAFNPLVLIAMTVSVPWPWCGDPDRGWTSRATGSQPDEALGAGSSSGLAPPGAGSPRSTPWSATSAEPARLRLFDTATRRPQKPRAAPPFDVVCLYRRPHRCDSSTGCGSSPQAAPGSSHASTVHPQVYSRPSSMVALSSTGVEMHCPFCRHTDSKVLDSRIAEEGGVLLAAPVSGCASAGSPRSSRCSWSWSSAAVSWSSRSSGTR